MCIALGTEDAKVTDVNGVANSFSPVRQGKLKLDQNRANTIHDGEVE